MSYFNQNVIAQGEVDGLTVIIREGLNDKANLELRIVVPKELWSAYNDVPYRFEQRGDLYFGENKATGEVCFYAVSENKNGFGGATYNLNMIDGSVATLKGPWSSRSGVMNAAGFKPSKEVNIQSRYNMSSSMTVERINELIVELGYVCVFEHKRSDYDHRYHIITLDELSDRIYMKCCELDSPNSPDFENLRNAEFARFGIEAY